MISNKKHIAFVSAALLFQLGVSTPGFAETYDPLPWATPDAELVAQVEEAPAAEEILETASNSVTEAEITQPVAETAEAVAEVITEEAFGDDNTPFEHASISNDDLDSTRGGTDTLVLTEQSAYMQGNTMTGNFTTGDVSISNSFNGMTGIALNVLNTGNQVNINAATTVNVQF